MLEKDLKIVETWTYILENRFKIGPFRFGLDALLGLVPGGGDILSAILALYIVSISVRSGLPDLMIRKMLMNIAIDLVIGLVPIVGDAGDFVFKSNVKNLRILNGYLGRPIEGELGAVK